jgi:ASC-1-like (ASCH) protein
LAEVVTNKAEQHKQSAAMAVSTIDFTVFSFSLLKLLLDLAALRCYDQFHEMFRHTGLESFSAADLSVLGMLFDL